MATPAEKVAQLEAALRARFFPHVPKSDTPERRGWTEEQHDIDRLSRALSAYALVALTGIDDASAASAITDGSNDGGIDALHFYRAGNQVIFVQGKYKRTGAAPDQADVLKTINGVRALIDRRFATFNQAIQGRLDEIEEALDTAGVKLCVVMAFLGENLGAHAVADLNSFRDDLNRLSPRMSWELVGLDRAHGFLVSEQTPIPVDINVALENWAAVVAPRKAIYGQIQAVELARLVETHGTALFQRNIRHYLGSFGLNTAIEETVRRQPAEFFYLNNGLTAVAERIEQAPGNAARCVFGLKNVSIVNGAQTAGSVATAAMAAQIAPDARLMITIIELGAGAEELGLRITKARNHQNVVRGVDFAALDPDQERLRRELASVGLTYHYRPSADARARRDDAFTLEDAALALACFSFTITHSNARPRPEQNAVNYVVAAKGEIGRLWEQGGAMYGAIFPPSLSGLRVCRAVRIYRLADQILADTERAETIYHRRMFFRHGRYFILAFLANRLPAVFSRAGMELTEEEKTAISQQINFLGELIYSLTVPRQEFRGYLATFRNLTDAQPLADAVLDRLAEHDAAARAGPAPAVAVARAAQVGTT